MADKALVLGGGGLTAYAWRDRHTGRPGRRRGGPRGRRRPRRHVGRLTAGVGPGGRSGPGRPASGTGRRERAMLDVDFTFAMTVKYLWAALEFTRPEDGDRTHRPTGPHRARRPGDRRLRSHRPSTPDPYMAARDPCASSPSTPSPANRRPSPQTATSTCCTRCPASCALPPLFPPIAIGTGRWMDGGVRSTTNADLVDDCARVVVLAPIPKAAERARAR
ncbi:hypothetical protein LV779_00780 [Streptomyces thinghirensis]|nr:hypothetical protein [Streptomyces thinghirensis]